MSEMSGLAPPAVFPLVAVSVAVLLPPDATTVGLKVLTSDGLPVPPPPPPTVSVAEPVTAGTDLLSNDAVLVAVAVAVIGTVMVAVSNGAIAAALVHDT